MVPQERDLITMLLARLKSTAGQAKDPEADGLIRQAMTEMPDAPYYLVQTVLIQDLSLHQAQGRIAELEQQLSDANVQKSSGTSFLGNLFGSRAAPPPAPVQPAGPWNRGPQVAPPPPPAGPGYPQTGYAQQPGSAPGGYGASGMMGGLGAMGGGGGGFLRSAAATAAGIAGGALLFQGISSMFGHSYASGLYGGGMNPGLGETIINNNYGDAGGGDYGGGGDYSAGGASGGGGDYGGGGDSGGGDAGGGDFGGGGDAGGGDFGGGGDTSC